jgi:hypothetical protein
MSAEASCRPRFLRPLFLWALACLLTEMAVEFFVGARPHPHALRFLMLLPLVPVALFVVSLVHTIQKMDELERRVALESIAIAFILTLLLTFVLAGLQSAEINVASLRDEVGTFMLFFWACAYLISVSRYR